MPEIGATLREARMRARIDLSEIEAQTKIRARYLRALENEEWDLLPGPTFIRSFLRTYATALHLDGKALVEEYRLHNEHPSEAEMQPIISPGGRRQSSSRRGDGGDSGGSRRPSRGYLITVGLVLIVIVFLVVGLLSRSTTKNPPAAAHHTHHATAGHRHGGAHSPHGTRHGRSAHTAPHTGNPVGGPTTTLAKATLTLQATATVWVCLLGEGEERLIPGLELQAGETSGPYHAKRFQMTLGNNDVTMLIDGKTVPVPPSTEAIGYEITSSSQRSLPAASQPTCQ